MTTPTQRAAQAAYLDAATTLTLLPAALRSIHDNLAGWPTRTPGANPDSSPSTTPETGNELTPDRARNDSHQLARHLLHAATALRAAANITTRWGLPLLDKTAIAERLAAIDRDIWCTNHLAHGMREPRKPTPPDAKTETTLCNFCIEFRAKHKRLPPQEITDHHARHGRLNNLDITRLLARADARLKAEKTAAKHAARAGAA